MFLALKYHPVRIYLSLDENASSRIWYTQWRLTIAVVTVPIVVKRVVFGCSGFILSLIGYNLRLWLFLDIINTTFLSDCHWPLSFVSLRFCDYLMCAVVFNWWVRGHVVFHWWVRGHVVFHWWVRGPVVFHWWVRGPVAFHWWVRGPVMLHWWVRGPVLFHLWVRGPYALRTHTVWPQWLEPGWLGYRGWFELLFQSVQNPSNSSRKQIFRNFLLLSWNCMLYLLIRIASSRRF